MGTTLDPRQAYAAQIAREVGPRYGLESLTYVPHNPATGREDYWVSLESDLVAPGGFDRAQRARQEALGRLAVHQGTRPSTPRSTLVAAPATQLAGRAMDERSFAYRPEVPEPDSTTRFAGPKTSTAFMTSSLDRSSNQNLLRTVPGDGYLLGQSTVDLSGVEWFPGRKDDRLQMDGSGQGRWLSSFVLPSRATWYPDFSKLCDDPALMKAFLESLDQGLRSETRFIRDEAEAMRAALERYCPYAYAVAADSLLLDWVNGGRRPPPPALPPRRGGVPLVDRPGFNIAKASDAELDAYLDDLNHRLALHEAKEREEKDKKKKADEKKIINWIKDEASKVREEKRKRRAAGPVKVVEVHGIPKIPVESDEIFNVRVTAEVKYGSESNLQVTGISVREVTVWLYPVAGIRGPYNITGSCTVTQGQYPAPMAELLLHIPAHLKQATGDSEADDANWTTRLRVKVVASFSDGTTKEGEREQGK